MSDNTDDYRGHFGAWEADLTEHQKLLREALDELAAIYIKAYEVGRSEELDLDAVRERERRDYEVSLTAEPEEWQPSTVDLNFLHDLRVGQLPDHGGWRYRYQQGSRLA